MEADLEHGILLRTVTSRSNTADNMRPARRWMHVVLPVGLLAIAAPVAVLISASSPHVDESLRTHTVTRGDLVVTLTERGTLESSNNHQIKCKVGGHNRVTWVIESGAQVEPGDELVRLDTKMIDQEVSDRTTEVHMARAILERTRMDVAKAEVAIEEYLQGRYRSQLKGLEKELKIADANLLTARKMLNQARQLFKRGFVTELEIEANEFTIAQAELELEVVETRIDVLNQHTKAMEMETLNGQLTATQARLKGRTAGLKLEQSRRAVALEQLENCVVRAPQQGMVIFPSVAAWKDSPDLRVGATVHDDQVLLLMPDLSNMQVSIGVHESMVGRIEPGMLAQVTLPNSTIEAEISEVGLVANPTQSSGSSSAKVVKYDTLIDLPSVDGLKPGMSAEVEVIIARHENVLVIPVSAVVEIDGAHCCWVSNADRTSRRSLSLGDSNDQFIIVQEGLAHGDEVVLNPRDSVTEARSELEPPAFHTIMRGELVETVTETGTLESSNNKEIRCQVRGDSTVTWVIDNGAEVQRGDELIRLDNKHIEDFIGERTKYAHLSRDAAIGALAHAARAKIAISEFEQGRYVAERKTLEKDLTIAESNLRSARNMHDHTRRMSDRGYVSELDVEQKQLAVVQAEQDVEIKKTEIEVHNKYTKIARLTELKGFWRSADAEQKAHAKVLELDETRIDLAHKEVQRCVVKAETSGLVIYPTTADWKHVPDITVGATVHDNQVMLLMPDLTKMQVKVGIHQTVINRIQPGMVADVKLPVGKLNGEIASVSSVTIPSSWNGNSVKYDAIIQLPPADGLKPGMSAEVKIAMARHQNVLMIPIAAVLDSSEGPFCRVRTAAGTRLRSLTLGAGNDEFIIVESGVQEGDEVMLDPKRTF